MKPWNFILILCLLLGALVPGHGQVGTPASHEFCLSKVGQEGATETEAQAQVLLELIRDTAFIDQEQKVVAVVLTPARLYYVDRIVQRLEPQKFVIERCLRHPDGSKMANIQPRQNILRTSRPQSWVGGERPERKIFAKEDGTERYLGIDGKTRRMVMLREVKAEDLGLRTILRSDLDAITREGHVFQVTEFVPQEKGKPPLRRVWQVKW